MTPRRRAREAQNVELHEFNPMLGHRGCRLAVTYPEIYEMQVRAILEAACEVAGEGVEVQPEIMIPLAMTRRELERMQELVDRVARDVFAETGRTVPFPFGTMIELPARGAHGRRARARCAEFFCFGTNDLTQTTMGLSRDDAGKFLPAYVEQGHLAGGSVQSLDVAGVGRARRASPARRRAPQSTDQARRLRRARRRSGSRFASSTSGTSTTCRARRSACRSRASPRRRRRFPTPPPTALRDRWQKLM